MKKEFRFYYKGEEDIIQNAKVEGNKVVIDNDNLKDKNKLPFFSVKHAQNQIKNNDWIIV